jgi:predicted phosphodiesterase
MSQTIKLLTVSDLHCDKSLVEQLAKAVKQHKPDILAVVGDFLDATPFEESKFTVDELARAFSKLPVGEILFVRGNHEDSALWNFQQEFEATGKAFRLLDHSALAFGPLVIVGFPWS